MTYKPEHVTDLESGAIVAVEVRPGDAADNDESLSERVLTAVGTLQAALPEETHEKLGSELCGDEGYHALESMQRLQELGVRTVIGDPQAGRRNLERTSAQQRATLQRASRSTRSASGKALLRKRGEHLERSFAHILDHGGLRRTTLRGGEKLTKRHMTAAMTYNLSLLMRTLFGVGTPKQAKAAARKRLLAAIRGMFRVLPHLLSPVSPMRALPRLIHSQFSRNLPPSVSGARIGRFSTGC